MEILERGVISSKAWEGGSGGEGGETGGGNTLGRRGRIFLGSGGIRVCEGKLVGMIEWG